MRRIAPILLCALLVFSPIIVILSINEDVKAVTITVNDDGGADYTNIQDAIDNATDGDIIYIFNGTYIGSIVVNKQIELIGEDKNGTIIIGDGGQVVRMESSNSKLTNLKIQGGGYLGIAVLGTNNRVDNCIVCNFSSDSGIEDSSLSINAFITDTTIYSCYNGMELFSSTTKVDNVNSSSRIWIEGGIKVTNSYFSDEIRFYCSNWPTLTNCTLGNIWLFDHGTGTLIDCTYNAIYIWFVGNSMDLKVYNHLTILTYNESGIPQEGVDIKVENEGIVKYSTGYYGGSDAQSNSSGMIEPILCLYRRVTLDFDNNYLTDIYVYREGSHEIDNVSIEIFQRMAQKINISSTDWSVCDPIESYWHSQPFVISARILDSYSYQSISLYYSNSLDNNTWSTYQCFATKMSSPWEWNFNFPSDYGYYRFYTIAIDIDSFTELPPEGYDTICGFDDIPPTVTLNTPTNNSVISSGTLLDFSIIDPNLLQVNYTVNGEVHPPLPHPFDISTIEWADGDHTIQINALDSLGNSNSSWFFFIIDSTPPTLWFNQTLNHSTIPVGRVIQLNISDPHLSEVFCSLDEGNYSVLTSPYIIDTINLTDGSHVILIIANDTAGNKITKWFEISIDANPPYVVSTIPINRSTDIDINTTIILAFTESMNQSDVENFIFISPSNEFALDWNSNGTVLYISFVMNNLEMGTTYNLTIDSRITDINDIPMGSDFVIVFTTKHLDTDSDGIPDFDDEDDDNDGYLDEWEEFLKIDPKDPNETPLDTDDDGIPDGDETNSQPWMDKDDDGDEILDVDDSNPLNPTKTGIESDKTKTKNEEYWWIFIIVTVILLVLFTTIYFIRKKSPPIRELSSLPPPPPPPKS